MQQEWAAAQRPGAASAPMPSHQLIDQARPRVEAALAALRAGGCVVIADDRPGGIAMGATAGALVTPESTNDFVTACGGIIAVTLDEARADALDLPAIARRGAPPETPFYAVSCEAAAGVSTGISAGDRAVTTLALCDANSSAHDLVRPGHIMPIRIGTLGVLRRGYAPEAAHDLVRAAGLPDGAMVSHLLDGHGEVTADSAAAFAKTLGWPLVWVADVALWRATKEQLLRVLEQGELAAAQGRFQVEVYQSLLDGAAHLLLSRGDLGAEGIEPPLVRIHSQCLTGDVLHSQRCDCGDQLQQALAAVAAEPRGAVLYLSQEGRGIGLVAKIRAYALQDRGLDTIDANLQLGFAADQRDYAVAAQMLRRAGVTSVRLLTNNPDKVSALERLGITVASVLPLRAPETEGNRAYLQSKRERLGHTV